MVWPVHCVKEIATNQTWMWIIAAYAGYCSGLNLAHQLKQHRSGAEAWRENFAVELAQVELPVPPRQEG